MRMAILVLGAALSGVAAAQTVTAPQAQTLRSGSWSYAATATGSDAAFMDSSGTAVLILRCTRANRSVILSVRGVPAASLALWTSSVSRTLPATYDPASARVGASLNANDPLLDAIAFSRGRFSVTVAGMAPLMFPAWPETARAVEDCRN
ncbi:MAG: hypothetical protein ABIO43_09745 [Sphingomicrobium sp.]